MNTENAKKRLLDLEQELSYSQRIAIADLLESQQADLLEMAKAVQDKCIQDEGDFGECIYCNEGGWGYSVLLAVL